MGGLEGQEMDDQRFCAMLDDEEGWDLFSEGLKISRQCLRAVRTY